MKSNTEAHLDNLIKKWAVDGISEAFAAKTMYNLLTTYNKVKIQASTGLNLTYAEIDKQGTRIFNLMSQEDKEADYDSALKILDGKGDFDALFA